MRDALQPAFDGQVHVLPGWMIHSSHQARRPAGNRELATQSRPRDKDRSWRWPEPNLADNAIDDSPVTVIFLI